MTKAEGNPKINYRQRHQHSPFLLIKHNPNIPTKEFSKTSDKNAPSMSSNLSGKVSKMKLRI